MKLSEFADRTSDTSIYPDHGTGGVEAINYCVVGLCGEAGELANKWKKYLRGDHIDSTDGLVGEAFDTIWYTLRLLKEIGVDIDESAKRHLEYLAGRKTRDVVQGSGDGR